LSPVTNHSPRIFERVCSRRLKYWVAVLGPRTIRSPASPGGTSAPFSSMILTSYPPTGTPVDPAFALPRRGEM
jgi:hypothetical protein